MSRTESLFLGLLLLIPLAVGGFALPRLLGFDGPGPQPAPEAQSLVMTDPTPVPTANRPIRGATGPSVTATAIPTRARADVPTAVPAPGEVEVAGQRATPVVPPTSTPQSRATPASPGRALSGAASPVDAVTAFYDSVARQDFERAAALWTPRMQAAYPVNENIDQRFGQTRSITVQSADVTSVDERTGRATVAVSLVEVTSGGVQQHVGTWSLVRGTDGWLLDQPRF